MNKNEAESVIKETIEYANKEIEKNKKKTLRGAIIAVCMVVVIVVIGIVAVTYESPVKYSDNLISVNVPEDEGIDISINLNNYKSADGILVKQADGTYDLYIGITQTLITKVSKSDETLVRVGSGIIVDYNSEKLIAFMPEETVPEDIMHVYYIDNLTDEIMCMNDSELINYANKTLVWTR